MSSAPSLLVLPEVLLGKIISYAAPSEECQAWEWIGAVGQTCRALRPVVQSLAPPRLSLAHFEQYRSYRPGGSVVDARVGILRSLSDFSWKRQHLKELHVNVESVLETRDDSRRAIHEGVLALLRALVTESSLPELEWLDIQINPWKLGRSGRSVDFDRFDLIDTESLRLMPSALPHLENLSLYRCFGGETGGEVSPQQLMQFFQDLRTPLRSLSLGGAPWLTDDHVEAFLPLVGQSLTCLELNAYHLSDRSLSSITRCCAERLQSLTIPAPCSSSVTEAGLERMLSDMDIANLYLALCESGVALPFMYRTQEELPSILALTRVTRTLMAARAAVIAIEEEMDESDDDYEEEEEDIIIEE